jgi:dTDP-glucose 4,6-dehydratase
MKKILVTGSSGFIGSHLTEECVKEGFNVRAFIHYNSMNDRGWLEKSPYAKHIEFIAGDIRDYDSVHAALKGCDAVFHLAALIGIPYSYVSPLAYIRTNVEGTYNVLQASRELKLQQVIVTSTSETYGSAQFVPIHEKHPYVGQSPYSATKIAADQLSESYYRSFHLPVKIVRPFNTFGPRQSARAIIPTIISQIVSGKKELHLGNLAPTRDFTYVKDTVQGFLAVGRSKNLAGEVVNIGMNEEISVGDLAKLIAKLTNKKVKILEDGKRVRPQKSEVDRLRCDNTKILRETNWRPQYTLEQGLKETIEFIKKHLAVYKPDIYNV